MYTVKSNTGLYYQWRSVANGDWRGQWLTKEQSSKYPIKSRKQLQALQSMFPELTLVWEKD